MARRHRHEEHENHEAWAIPYGDLVTLLLAFFVVMYAISNVNEGKYRAMSESLSAAFKGAPRRPEPIAIGERTITARAGDPGMVTGGAMVGTNTGTGKGEGEASSSAASVPLTENGMSKMDEIVGQVETAMAEQIENQTLKVRRNGSGVEIEISTDSLFSSGSASMAAKSVGVMEKLADTLKALPYSMRVEGHTDNRPISTSLFPSNWELSAARAATVVHLFTQRGVDPAKMAVIGLGEFRPREDNSTEAGRNANRRVRVIILSDGDRPEEEQNLKSMDAANADQASLVTATESAPTSTTVGATVPASAQGMAPATAAASTNANTTTTTVTAIKPTTLATPVGTAAAVSNTNNTTNTTSATTGATTTPVSRPAPASTPAPRPSAVPTTSTSTPTSGTPASR